MSFESFKFGVEIEFVAKPLERRKKNMLEDYDIRTKWDDLKSSYRKHTEYYKESWWITRDNSLKERKNEGNSSYLVVSSIHRLVKIPWYANALSVAVEAVSPTLKTGRDWEYHINIFWEAQGPHLPVPYLPWYLEEVKKIAIGVMFYESKILNMLPKCRRGNKYCQMNGTNSTAIQHIMEKWQHMWLLCDDFDKAWPAYLPRVNNEIQNRITAMRTIDEVVDFMQDDRRMLWNFENLTRRKSGRSSGTIEFRGGPALTGPQKTKRWVVFTVGAIQLVSDKNMVDYGLPEESSIEDVYEEIRAAASEHNMGVWLPHSWKLLNETARLIDNLSDDDSAYGSDISSVRSSGDTVATDYDWDSKADDNS
ncbi:hypothetical protein BS50DRAFT_589132 [Corynespora cassiicola Philippines]|uniref:Uncharacterized protein n=1 Tax=Corynespora cassiicola Philippines TaxID=1448308 RepID=A0A2T2NLT4_CORCC|nr:hypothetical protein BS50DRAFT_589132 [Corynespora cassiicola Philippines]